MDQFNAGSVDRCIGRLLGGCTGGSLKKWLCRLMDR